MTAKQKELINCFLAGLQAPDQGLYSQLVQALDALGYGPRKERGHLVFKHSCHNKQIAKLGLKKTGDAQPFFALRFSACQEYSPRFQEVVRQEIARFSNPVAHCTQGMCSFCAGEPSSHVYHGLSPDGQEIGCCGSRALEIPNLRAEDLPEISRMLGEEHAYLMAHEAKPA